MRDVIRRRRWRDDESGMSLIEIMIAVFVLSVGLLALASTAITSIVNLRVSRGRQEATDAASALIEDLRRTDFTTVALDENDADVQTFLTSTGGCDPAFDEPLVATTQPGGIPREQSFGPSGRVTVRTSVSWYDEGDDNGCLDASHDTSVKRVQVVAEWEDGDRTYTVEESTLVAPVDRGLPAPDFRIGTPSAALSFTADDVANEREQCVGHLLRNLGAEDTYEIEVRRTSSGSISTAGRWGYYAENSNQWTIRAFLAHPPQDPPVSPATLGISPTHNQRDITGHPDLELLYDDVGDGNVWREAVTPIATGDTARLWMCFRSGDNLNDGDTATFETTVYSRFDPNRSEVIEHQVGVSDTFVDYFLYDDYDKTKSNPTTSEASTERVVKVKGTELLPVLTMGPETSIEPELLGSTPAIPNYDIDFDSLPGTRLLDSQRIGHSSDPTWPASSIAFDEQLATTTTFGGSGEFTLWSASESALVAQANGDSTVASQNLEYEVQLQVLADDESTVVETVFTAPVPYTHTAVGWQSFTVGFSLSSFTVPQDHYLRLKVTCKTASSSDTCHLGYDHQSLPSKLQLAVQS